MTEESQDRTQIMVLEARMKVEAMKGGVLLTGMPS